ncbi:hypothetical protein BLA29_005901 [Euroglyphus maynei]|uniref:Uncharacterized protein n=1 Tax=Euroglyphus maynei TaxID=6958 RepID=A0A1Y3BJU0_EURMA|nr:hypothetical protein BLA29_005901 [Euroglyphus maynei]
MLITIFLVMFSGTLAESLFDYNDYSCGSNLTGVNELIERFQMFKRNSAEMDHMVKDFLDQAKSFREESIKRMLEIDNELLTFNRTELMLRVKYEQEKIRCEKVRQFSELLAMQLFAHEHGMFDFDEEKDPDIDFDRKMKNFFNEIFDAVDLMKILGDLEKGYNNSASKEMLKMGIGQLLQGFGDFQLAFVQKVKIHSTMMSFSSFRNMLNDVLEDINQSSKI